jgi:chemotaxis response regulator CheB
MTLRAIQDVAAVVIGASAGGIEALGVLLPALDAR